MLQKCYLISHKNIFNNSIEDKILTKSNMTSRRANQNFKSDKMSVRNNPVGDSSGFSRNHSLATSLTFSTNFFCIFLNKKLNYLKFIFSEKATNICEICLKVLTFTFFVF